MSKINLEKTKNFIFYQIIGIGLGFLSVFLIIGVGLYSRLELIVRSLFGKLETICDCANLLSFTNHPFIFTSLILSGLSFLAFFSFAAGKIFKIKKATDKFVKAVKARSKNQLSPKLKKAVKSAGLDGKVVEVEDDKPFVFCFGWISPKICASSKLIKELNKAELTVALLHEKQHLFEKEPMKLFLIKSAVKILFFAPGLKALVKKYVVFSEITADGLATNNWRNKKTLARALDKIIKSGQQSVLTNNLAISFFTTIDERINKLADDKYYPVYNFWTPKFLLTVFVLLFSVAAFVGFARYSQPVMAHSSESSACLVMPVESTKQCQMSAEASCAMNYGLDARACG